MAVSLNSQITLLLRTVFLLVLGRPQAMSPAVGASFFGSSTAGNATLTAQGGLNGGDGGFVYFAQDSIGGTSHVQVSGNGRLDISAHNAPGVTVGSIEGDGNIFLGANELAVGSNDLSTIFSGVIQDSANLGDGTGGSLTKVGTGTLSLTNPNTYTGGTRISAGTLQALHDGALGGGDVTMLTPGATLTLQNGTNNDYIADTATVNLVSSATVNLN